MNAISASPQRKFLCSGNHFQARHLGTFLLATKKIEHLFDAHYSVEGGRSSSVVWQKSTKTERIVPLLPVSLQRPRNCLAHFQLKYRFEGGNRNDWIKKAFTSIITLKIPPVLKTLIFLIILKTLTLLRTLHNFWQWKQLILQHLSRVRYISGNVLGVKGDVYRTLLTNFFMRWEVLTFVTHTN